MPSRFSRGTWLVGLLLLVGGFCLSDNAPQAAETKAAAWPLTPLLRPAVPAVKDKQWPRNPVDAFVLYKLEQANLVPNPAADKRTLLRRVTYDLTGLPPTSAEVDAFVADRSADAYEKVVERLLASPHFGERWAQHWLDVVRYAETEGFKLDRMRYEAFRYRDYVIRAFNDDMPYDRFLRQQIAGDEVEPDNPDALIATGLFRLHPEESNGSNYKQIRQEILDDVTDVFSATFLGLTMGCARCHNHKFDPIPQKDYFRLQAFFTPMVQHDDLPLAPQDVRQRYEKEMNAWREKTRDVRVEMDQLLNPVGREVFKESVAVFDLETQDALKLPAEKRSPLQRQLAVLATKQIDRKYLKMHRRLTPDKKERFSQLQQKLGDYDSAKPRPLPMAMAVTDVGPVSPATFRLANGNYLKPLEEVQPGYPSCLGGETPIIQPPPGDDHSTGRRSALARWLSRADHPLTSRVVMNRLWLHYFGQGIVATANDFGVMGDKPTHPELLDYLATELPRQGWKLKSMHRTIVTSSAYRQSSRDAANPTAALAAKVDPENHLLWHARTKRRDAEAIRDAALVFSGRLNERMYGLSAQPALPKAAADSRYAWYADDKAEDRDRRSVYILAKRNFQYPLFAVFDVPDRFNSCPTRSITTTAPQALAMLNGELTMAQARYAAGRLLARPNDAPRDVIRKAYFAAYGRGPDADETLAAERFLQKQAKRIATAGIPSAEILPEPMPRVDAAYAAAVVDLCHALMNAAEFITVE